MKRKSLMLKMLALLPLLVGLQISFSYAHVNEIPIPEVHQEQSNWCWAACSQAILKYYDRYYEGIAYGETYQPIPSQCEIVERARSINEWGDGDCCDDPFSSVCNQVNSMRNTSEYPEGIKSILEHWGELESNCLASDILTSDEIKAEIDQGRPFIMRLDAFGDHFVVAYGYETDQSGVVEWVYYMDPIANGPGYRRESYSCLEDGGCSGPQWLSTLTLLNPPELPALSNALNFLQEGQNPVCEEIGSWILYKQVGIAESSWESVWLTSVATLAYLNYGIGENHETVARAISWILSKQDSQNGRISFHGSLKQYSGCMNTLVPEGYVSDVRDTAFAILALVATRNLQYYPAVQAAAQFLVDTQTTEAAESLNSGGWSYNSQAQIPEIFPDPNIRDTKLALQALDYAEQFDPNDTIVEAEVWDKAEAFVSRCQDKWKEIVNLGQNTWAFAPVPYDPLDPSEWPDPYGVETASGLSSLYACGVDVNDERVMSAWDYVESGSEAWRLSTSSWDRYHGFYEWAHAFTARGEDYITGYDWYEDIITKLLPEQHPSGWWEDYSHLQHSFSASTALAVLALESKRIPPGTGLNFKVASPVELRVYDPNNQLHIPEDPDNQFIHIARPIAGTYRVELVPIEEGGHYTLTIEGLRGDQVVTTETQEGTVAEGEIYDYEAKVSTLVGPITIDLSSNSRPLADAGLDQTVVCANPEGTSVMLDGSGSSDPDGNALSYTWTGPFPEGGGVVTGVDPTVTLPLGVNKITLIVNDGKLNSPSDEVSITINVAAVEGLLPPLAALVREGEEVFFPDKAFKCGRTMPLKLQLFCGDVLLSDADVSPPKIEEVLRTGDGDQQLELIVLDSGEANDNGSLFRFSDDLWIFNLSTKNLPSGRYKITIEMPDGRLFSTGFVLR